jgi:Fur family peroxide stress response transcriptional regulator
METKEIVKLFKERGFRATPQRIAVYQYLCDHPTHPDVDTIYNELVKEHPAFSRTTVYNSLDALAKENLVMTVTIDPERIHYDATTKPHGHFYCKCCKRIIDFAISNLHDISADGFEVHQQDVYYKGICPDCLTKQ